jgi:DNA-binding CsgD family transcriptional regulator
MERASDRDAIDEPGIFMWRDLQVEALVRSGRLQQAEAVLVPFEERAAARGRRSAMGSAARVRGLLEAERGNVQAASEAFSTAVDHLGAVGMPFEEALVHLAAGSTFRRCGARRTAAEHLQAASTVFTMARALPFMEICEREMRGCGLRHTRRSGEEPPRLTPQENSVATLVASGLSNREVAAELMLSVKTIEYHLVNTFAKLGVRSRTQLVHHIRAKNAGEDDATSAC